MAVTENNPDILEPDEIATKMGRPKIILDWQRLDRYCAIHCTLEEIACLFGCSEDTIERRVKEKFGMTFAEYFRIKSADGKRSLRRKQFQVAMSGNPRMLQWLGQSWLKQNARHEHVGANSGPIQLSYSIDDDE